MGLDMYGFTTSRNNVVSDVEVKNKNLLNEFFYWRKHPDLHGWFKALYEEKGGQAEFNCELVRLESGDLDRLEEAIKGDMLPHTEGFFFGESYHDKDERENDLRFIQLARDALGIGLAVFYQAWW